MNRFPSVWHGLAVWPQHFLNSERKHEIALTIVNMWLPISVRDGDEKNAVLKNEGLVWWLVRNVVGKKPKRI